MKRTFINTCALAVVMVGGWMLAAPSLAHAAAAAKCTIGGVTVEGDICTSDGKTCKCA